MTNEIFQINWRWTICLHDGSREWCENTRNTRKCQAWACKSVFIVFVFLNTAQKRLIGAPWEGRRSEEEVLCSDAGIEQVAGATPAEDDLEADGADGSVHDRQALS